MRKLVLSLVLTLATVSAQARLDYNPQSAVVPGPVASDEFQAKRAFLKGDFNSARNQWLNIAAKHQKAGRFQQAAWSFYQAGLIEEGDRQIRALEERLRTDSIISQSPIGTGYTKPVQLSFGEFRAVAKTQFFNQEVAAYLLDRLLGLNMIPVTIIRDIDGKRSSVQFWIDDGVIRKVGPTGEPSVLTSDQLFFDFLTDNPDRHGGNIVMREGDYLALIDNGLAFGGKGGYKRDFETVPREEVYLRLKSLTPETISKTIGPHLTAFQLGNLLNKRLLLINRIEKMISVYGRTHVFAGVDFRIPFSTEALVSGTFQNELDQRWKVKPGEVGLCVDAFN